MLATKLDLANSSLYRRGKEVKSWLFYWMVNVNMFRDCEVKTEKKTYLFTINKDTIAFKRSNSLITSMQRILFSGYPSNKRTLNEILTPIKKNIKILKMH